MDIKGAKKLYGSEKRIGVTGKGWAIQESGWKGPNMWTA